MGDMIDPRMTPTGGSSDFGCQCYVQHGCGASVDLGSWQLPPVFAWLAKAGGVSETEMLKTFNSGIGMVVVVAADKADEVAEVLAGEGESVCRLGVVTDEPGMSYSGNLS